MNAQDLIIAAYRKLRVAKVGYEPTADELQDGLSELNSMLAAWSEEGFLLPSLTRETLTLTPGVNPHTIGTTGTLNTVQPLAIAYATLVSGGISTPLDLMTLAQYDAIAEKAQTGEPGRYYFETGQTLGRLYFDYVPDAAYSLVLDSEKPITSFATLTTSNVLATGAERAVIYNLAIELAPEYGKEPSPTVIRLAGRYLRTLKRHSQVRRIPKLKSDAAFLSRRRASFNINAIN